MSLLGIRDFSRRVSRCVESVVETGEPLVLTKHGRAVAVVVAIDDERLEDFVFAHVPEFTAALRAADVALARGETTSLRDALAEAESRDEADATAAARESESEPTSC